MKGDHEGRAGVQELGSSCDGVIRTGRVQPRWGRAGLDKVAEDPEDLRGIGCRGEDRHLGTAAGTAQGALAVRGAVSCRPRNQAAAEVGEVLQDLDKKLCRRERHETCADVRIEL